MRLFEGAPVRHRWSRSVLALNLVAVCCAFGFIWGREISIFWAWPPSISASTIEQAISRPGDAELQTIAAQRLGLGVLALPIVSLADPRAVRASDQLLAGRVRFPKLPEMPIDVPFSAANLDEGTPTHQLYVAGLGTLDLLLRAYRASGNEAYFSAARRELSAYADVDRRTILPRGFLWNDHALANRMAILADYWQLLRSRPDMNEEEARQVLALASTTAQRLAESRLFIYRTNHGVMQNVALFQYALAFPMMADARHMAELACRRMTDQMTFYISPEGVTLEHSATYHEFGRYLLEMAIPLAEKAMCPSAGWQAKLDRAREFSSLLRRPDGTLPPVGNTDYIAAEATYGNWRSAKPPRSTAVFPLSGFAIWWSGLDSWPVDANLTQSVITWSRFPSRAHKRADDMSLNLWAFGRTWVGNTGYWPYGAEGFDQAGSWRGSNAPHAVSEGTALREMPTLTGFVDAPGVRALHLERRTASGDATIRRQIVELDGGIWIVADSFTGPPSTQVARVWGFTPETRTISDGNRSFTLLPPTGSKAGRVSILGDLAAAPEILRGQLNPFGGWIVRAGNPTPSAALSVVQEQPGKPVITVFELTDAGALEQRPLPKLRGGSTSDDWSVRLSATSGEATVGWDSSGVHLEHGDRKIASHPLTPAPTTADKEREEIVAAYAKLAEAFPGYRDLSAYRLKVTYLALALLFLQESLLFALRRRTSAVATLRLTATVAWILFGLYVTFWYLV